MQAKEKDSAEELPLEGDIEPQDSQDQVKILETSPQSRFRKYDELIQSTAWKTTHKAYDVLNGTEVAWHTINLFSFRKEERKNVLNVIGSFRKHHSPHFLNVLESWTVPHRYEVHYITELTTGGCFQKYLSKIVNPKLKIIKKWARDMLTGLQELRKLTANLPFYNLSLSHVFINSTVNRLKLSIDPLVLPLRAIDYFVSLPPEVFNCSSDKESTQIYTFGAAILQICTQKSLWQGSVFQNIKTILDGYLPRSLDALDESCEIKHIIKKCMNPDPAKRYRSLQDLSSLAFWYSEDTGDKLPLRLIHIADPSKQRVFKYSKTLSSQVQKNQQTYMIGTSTYSRVEYVLNFGQPYTITVESRNFSQENEFSRIVNFLDNQFEENTFQIKVHPPNKHEKFQQKCELQLDLGKNDYEELQKTALSIVIERNSSHDLLVEAIRTQLLQSFEQYRSKVQDTLRVHSLTFDEWKHTLESIEKKQLAKIWKDEADPRILALSPRCLDYLSIPQSPIELGNSRIAGSDSFIHEHERSKVFTFKQMMEQVGQELVSFGSECEVQKLKRSRCGKTRVWNSGDRLLDSQENLKHHLSQKLSAKQQARGESTC